MNIFSTLKKNSPPNETVFFRLHKSKKFIYWYGLSKLKKVDFLFVFDDEVKTNLENYKIHNRYHPYHFLCE